MKGLQWEQLQEFLPFLIPLIVVEIILLFVTLRHILTHDYYRWGNRKLWILITIVGMQFWGPILYFLIGKEEE